jgi:hypothetical protein
MQQATGRHATKEKSEKKTFAREVCAEFTPAPAGVKIFCHVFFCL